MWWLLNSGSGKKITREEFLKEVRPRLRDRGVSIEDLDFLEACISGAMNESGSQSGIDKKELDEVLRALKENAPGHLSDENLKRIEEELRKAL